MKNIKLRDVLENKEIKAGLKSDLFKTDELTDLAVKDTLALNKEVTSIKLMVDGKTLTFEAQLHYDNKQNLILLESRLFDDVDGQMINAYLMILDKDLNLIKTDDDVWSYADWQ